MRLSERVYEVEMKLLEGSAGRSKPRTLSPKPYITLSPLGTEGLHHVLIPDSARNGKKKTPEMV